MHSRSSLILTFGMFPFWASTAMQAQPPSARPDLRIERVELSDIGADSVQATVRLSAVARSNATLENLVFEDATINGMRVRVPPVPGPIRLQNGQAIEGFRELPVIVTYRELESLEPIRRAARDGTADVHVVVRGQIQLTLFEKLALRVSGAWVNIQVDQRVPVELPGGELGRFAAFATLTAAEPAWRANRSAQVWLRNRTTLASEARAGLAGKLVSLETRYELKSRDGEIASLRSRSLGFLVGRGQVVATAEAIEPWNFNDSMAEALERGDIRLNEERTEVLATLSSGRTFSLRGKDLTLVKKLSAGESAVSVTTKRRYHVNFRNRDNNAVLLEIPSLKDAGGDVELSTETLDGEWQPAAVMRVGQSEQGDKPVLWLTEAKWENGRYLIKDLVDSTAFGSPLWVQGGVAGLLQDESSATDISHLLKKLR